MRRLTWLLAGSLLAASVVSEATAQAAAFEAVPPRIANVSEAICGDLARNGWQPSQDTTAALTRRIEELFRGLPVAGADPAREAADLTVLLARDGGNVPACVREVRIYLASMMAARLYPDQPLETNAGRILEEIDRVTRGWQAASGTLAVPRATRIFAGPSQYPPSDFASYAIIAFRSLATAHDSARHQLICEAFVSTLPDADALKRSLGVPLNQQIVTVWPVDDGAVADRLNVGGQDPCTDAVQHYDLIAASTALREAALVGVEFPGQGPYLIAWSPAGSKGRPDAVVLVADLSHAETIEQAKFVFLDWIDDIEQNPSLWSDGWDMAAVRVTIRNWVDQYGEEVLKLFGGE